MSHHSDYLERLRRADAAELEQLSAQWRREHPVPEKPQPFPVRTLGLVLFVMFGLPIIGLVILGVLEWRTLADDTPGNHITATLRRAFKAEPGAVMLATVVWVGFLVAVVAGIGGHVFWGGCAACSVVLW